MVDVLDVATAIVERSTRLTTMQLQKLTYYVQAWHVTIYGEPVFGAEFQAWKDGPVAPELHDRYRGMKWVGSTTYGDSSKLTPRVNSVIDLVIAHYGLLDGDQLSLITHAETPWQATRGDTHPAERSQATITLDSMRQYYADKTLAGHTAVEIAVVGPNPLTRDAQEVAARLDEILAQFSVPGYETTENEDSGEARLVSGFEPSSYIEETSTPSIAR